MAYMTIQLKEDMAEQLEALSRRTGTSKAMLVRLAVGELLRKARSGEPISLTGVEGS